MSLVMETIPYKGWKNCARLANSQIELVVTGDVGPRVIRLNFLGQDNLFAEYPDQVGQTGGDVWRIYGGHRLWHAPEGNPRSYFPDNQPVQLHFDGQILHVLQPVEPTTGIQKALDITLAADAAHVRVVHRLTNHGVWPVNLAPWALSVMAPGGVAVVPLPPRGEHPRDLLPVNSLTFWSYTDMSDPRWTWGRKYILLRQDPNAAVPQKFGASLPDGWAAYALNRNLFVKTYQHIPGAAYPDFGCSFETFTNSNMLEVETLGPLTQLQPGASVEHIENWFLFDSVESPQTEADVERLILPHVQTILGH